MCSHTHLVPCGQSSQSNNSTQTSHSTLKVTPTPQHRSVYLISSHLYNKIMYLFVKTKITQLKEINMSNHTQDSTHSFTHGLLIRILAKYKCFYRSHLYNGSEYIIEILVLILLVQTACIVSDQQVHVIC